MHATNHGRTMVQSWVRRDLIKGSAPTRLGIISTPHEPADASIHQKPPAHIAHGSKVTTKVQSVSRQRPRTLPAD